MSFKPLDLNLYNGNVIEGKRFIVPDEMSHVMREVVELWLRKRKRCNRIPEGILKNPYNYRLWVQVRWNQRKLERSLRESPTVTTTKNRL